MILFLAALLTASAYGAASAPDVQGRAANPGEDDLTRRAAARLREDPEAAAALALRIRSSSLEPELSGKTDDREAIAALKKWISANPESAAHLAIGFAKDDRAGNSVFEDSLSRDMERFLEMNPDYGKGLYGRLDRASRFSRAMDKTIGLDDEQRQAEINALFSGTDPARGRKLERRGGPEEWKTNDKSAVAAGGAGGSLYDRLSSANLGGHSPEVTTLQNELNRSRPPGAPALIENGVLDYPTLSQPAFGLRYDIERLEAGLAAAQSWAKERKADGQFVGSERRKAALDKARAALARFEAEALKAKAPRGISVSLLRTLSSSRRDAARWITVASLEETIALLKSLRGFMTQPLEAAVAQVPVEESVRAAFLAHGRGLEKEIEGAVAAAEKAVSLLSSEESGLNWAQGNDLAVKARTAAKSLPRIITDYRDAPLKAAEGTDPQTGWRAWLDDLILDYLPNLGYSSRRLQRRADARARVEAFRKIALKAD